MALRIVILARRRWLSLRNVLLAIAVAPIVLAVVVFDLMVDAWNRTR